MYIKVLFRNYFSFANMPFSLFHQQAKRWKPKSPSEKPTFPPRLKTEHTTAVFLKDMLIFHG